MQPLVKGLTPPRNFPVTYSEREGERKAFQFASRRKQTNTDKKNQSERIQWRRMWHTQPALVCTCSFVVLPRATNTMWNPVRPATGTKNRPATHITAILVEEGQGGYNKSSKKWQKKPNKYQVKNHNANKTGKESPIICSASSWQQWAKWRIRNSSMWRVQLLAVVQDINQAKAKHVHDVGGKW